MRYCVQRLVANIVSLPFGAGQVVFIRVFICGKQLPVAARHKVYESSDNEAKQLSYIKAKQ